ncbi:MAG TPA: hypothetical protein VJ302_00575 [Blastocatellia bacterium]|nr:hypothetical protein [Blastocatellia bacterium]
MKEQLKVRLEELKREFEIGQTRLQELDRQQVLLRETLLRISGAIQVLQELSAEGAGDQQDPASAADPRVAAAATD